MQNGVKGTWTGVGHGAVTGGLYNSEAKDQRDRNRVSIQDPLAMTCHWLSPRCLVRAAVANQ